MSNKRTIAVFAAMVVLLIGIWLVYVFQSGRAERDLIRSQYQQLRLVLSQGDTNSAKKLFAPEYIKRADNSFRLLNTFAKPLGRKSSVQIWNSKATVTPERIWHFGLIPGGHSIELIKVDGQWLFTGKVNID